MFRDREIVGGELPLIAGVLLFALGAWLVVAGTENTSTVAVVAALAVVFVVTGAESRRRDG